MRAFGEKGMFTLNDGYRVVHLFSGRMGSAPFISLSNSTLQSRRQRILDCRLMYLFTYKEDVLVPVCLCIECYISLCRKSNIINIKQHTVGMHVFKLFHTQFNQLSYRMSIKLEVCSVHAMV